MDIVTKGNLKLIRQLLPHERAAIFSHYGTGISTSREQELAVKIASLTKSSDAWIQCDCTSKDNPAYLFPRQTESGSVTLVRPRPPRQNSHSASCSFYLADLPQNLSPDQSKTTTQPIQDFCLLRPERGNENSSKVSPGSRNSSTTVKLPRLTRVLLDLLERAGISHLDDTFPFHDHHKAIYRAAAQIQMWPGSKLMLSDVLSTSSAVSHYYSLISRLKYEKRFGVDRRKQGYVISLASSFTDFTVTLSSGQVINLLGKLSAPSRVPSGPYWAIILIAEPKPGSNYFEPMRCSIWPAYSDKLPFVVDSDPERHTLRELISWRLYWKSKGLDFAITKPLDFSTPIKPDFILVDKESGSRVVIETMGSKDEEYMMRKSHTHTLMANIGPVIEHRVNDDSFAFKKSVTAAIMA